MRKIRKYCITLGAALLLALVVIAHKAVTPSPAILAAYQVMTEVACPSVKIELPQGGGGSGTVIRQTDSEAYILTAHHVIDGVTVCKVSYIDGMSDEIITTEGKVLRSDKEHDLALVVTKPVWPRVAQVVTYDQYLENVTIYQPVVVSGYPLLVHSPHITTGYLCDLQENKKMRTSAHAIYGNSGGGIFMMVDGHWRLVGVLVSILTLDGNGVHPLPQLSFSVSTLDILAFLGSE